MLRNLPGNRLQLVAVLAAILVALHGGNAVFGLPPYYYACTPPTAFSVTGGGHYCAGGTGLAIGLSGSEAGVSYQLTASGQPSGAAVAGTGAAISFGLRVAAGSYTVLATRSPGCTATMNGSVSVVIDPIPSAGASVPAYSICSGRNIEPIVLTGGPAGTVYAWSRSNTNFVTGIPASGFGTISGGLTDTVWSPQQVVFTIVPSYNGCVGATVSDTVIVNPKPDISVDHYNIISCSGQTTDINLFSSVSGAEFNWTAWPSPDVYGAADGAGWQIHQPLRKENKYSGIVVYTISASYQGCLGANTIRTQVIVPRPNPVITDSTPVVCSGDYMRIKVKDRDASLLYSNDTAVLYTLWTPSPSPDVSGATSVEDSFVRQRLVNTTSKTAFVTYKYQSTYIDVGHVCKSDTNYFTVQVNPSPATVLSFSPTVCAGTEVSINLASTIPGTKFKWTGSYNGIAGLSDSGGTIRQRFPVPGAALFTITPTSFQGCKGADTTITIGVRPLPKITATNGVDRFDGSDTVCLGTANIDFDVLAPDIGYRYRWKTDSTRVSLSRSDATVASASFHQPGTYPVILTATAGAFSCSDSIVFVVSETAGIESRAIFAKQPGNLLVYPDNSADAERGYQWGYDSLLNGTTPAGAGQLLQGQVYQVFAPDKRFLTYANELDTTHYAFWLLLRKGECFTRIYYNGPFAAGRPVPAPAASADVSLQIVPNPNKGQFVLTLNGSIYGDIRAIIYNSIGQEVFRRQFAKQGASATSRIDAGDLPGGLYYVHLTSSDLQTVQTRFTIQP